MKRRVQSLYRISSSRQTHLSKSKPPPPPLPLSTINTTATATATILTAEDLSSIQTLTRRLCESNRLDSAIRLLSVSLLASPSPSSLPIPTLIDSLTSSPSAHSFSLLTSLRHTSPASLPSVSSLLLSSLLSKRRHADAWRVLAWFLKGDDSPCRPTREMYVAALRGFCAGGRGREGVRVAREMVRDGLAVGDDEREMLRRCLLREARVDEAADVDAAVAACDGDVLDRIAREWEE